MTARRHDCPDHNGSQWLDVRWLTTRQRGWRQFARGWYVVRTCPCHDGIPVTLPLVSEAEAERVRQVILDQ